MRGRGGVYQQEPAMCMGKAEQGSNSQQAVSSLFLPLLLHSHMGMCMPQTWASVPHVWGGVCLWVAHLGYRANHG